MKCGALMTHYHKLPEATAKVMTPDGYYRTRRRVPPRRQRLLLFRRPSRRHVRLRRREHLSGEVEKMLEKHPGIHQAPSIPVPDELKGHKPVAFVVRANGARSTSRR
jgi:acyl-CoA synthetase (AMP-forming)/AMP-acid ligase II